MKPFKPRWYGMLAISLLSASSYAGKFDRYIEQPEPREIQSTLSHAGHGHAAGARCGTEEAMSAFYKRFPDSLQRTVQERLDTAKRLKSQKLETKGMSNAPFSAQAISANPTYVIPVVFHVYGTTFNGKTVNDAIIIDALRKTNEDFQGQTADYADIIPEFAGVKRTLNIEFRLAKKDPNGYPTTGIVYRPAKSGYGNGGGYDAQIQADAWDNYKYMNVYIQNDLYADGSTTNSGVAWYPNTSMSNNNTARVVYNGAYLGNNTDENFRSVLTHEFGHFMDLIHTFEGGCSNGNENKCSTTGDKICDTPQVNNSSLGTAANCLGQTTNWQNFMNYSSQYANYTNHQVTRMINALNMPSRNTLWSAANLIATGTDGGGGTTNQPPTAKANGPYAAVVSASLNFSSAGSTDPDGSISSYSWSFGDGTNSTSANPSKSYSSAGTYTVTLTVTDNQGATGTNTTTATISAASTSTPLSNGVAKTGIAASTGQYVKFYIDVPAGASNLIVTTNGGTGDADMYVRQGAEPTDTTYNCRPYLSGNAETCTQASPAAGRWYINLKAYSTFSGVSLTATYTTGTPSNQAPIAKVNGPYSGSVNSNISFSSAGSSDPDGSISAYSWNFGDNTSSSSANPSHAYAAAGSYTVSLTVTDNQGATNTASTTVTISNSTPPGLPNVCLTQAPASNGTGIALNANHCSATGTQTNSIQYYYVYLPSSVSKLVFRSEHGTGNAGLYYSASSWATTSAYQQRSINTGNMESITVNNPSAGYHYISVTGQQSGVTLSVTTQ